MINLGRTLLIAEIPVAAIPGLLIEFAEVLQEKRNAGDLKNGSVSVRAGLCENAEAAKFTVRHNVALDAAKW